jgi:hypothetical protein
MVRKKKTAHSARGRSAKRREEQLELALPKPDDVIVRPIANLRGTSRLGAVSETQTKRIQSGVLVQQMLK